jgi:ABC-type nickel/cobalt efflux system permease component RcnA
MSVELFLVAVTLGFVHALGLIGARGWIVVFVLLLLALIRSMNLSGTLITDISGVLTALIGAILCRSRTLHRSTRDYEAREGNTEQAISNENIESHLSLLLERAHCWLTSTLRNETRKAGTKSRTLAFESYLPSRTGFAYGNCVR